MIGGLTVWHTMLSLVNVTSGLYFCTVITRVVGDGGLNLIALASFGANISLFALGCRGLWVLHMLGQVGNI